MQQQPILSSYLFGSQAAVDFRGVSGGELANALSDRGNEEAMDVLLTAFRVKLGQITDGFLSIQDAVRFVDDVAMGKGGEFPIDLIDEDLHGEIDQMKRYLSVPVTI